MNRVPGVVVYAKSEEKRLTHSSSQIGHGQPLSRDDEVRLNLLWYGREENILLGERGV